MDYKTEYRSQMTALADSIREKAGTSGKMTIDQMSSAVESITGTIVKVFNPDGTWATNRIFVSAASATRQAEDAILIA